MRPFSLGDARYFAEGFDQKLGPDISVLRYLETSLPGGTTLSEGTSRFDTLRTILLRETDRFIFLASSTFVRSMTGLRASSSSWCVVGLYYSGWYAAHAILGLLGCWIGKNNRWIDVARSNPGQQKLQYHTRNYASKYFGHRFFWHAYYSVAPNLLHWVSPAAATAMTPMSSNEFWFLDLRNRVNYHPREAFSLIEDFELNYDKTAIPTCFPGELSSAYQVARSFLLALQELSTFTAIQTDVFNPNRDRSTAIRQRVNGSKNRELSQFARNLESIAEF